MIADDHKYIFQDSDDDDCSVHETTRKSRCQRDIRAPEDITQEDLDMVATFVSDKKYDSIYVSKHFKLSEPFRSFAVQKMVHILVTVFEDKECHDILCNTF